MMTRERGGANTDPLRKCFITKIGAPLPRCNHDMHLEVVSANPHPLGTIESHGAKIGGVKVVFPDGVKLRLIQGVGIKRNLHSQNMRRAEKTICMILQPENGRPFLCMIGAHALEHTHAVMQRVG